MFNWTTREYLAKGRTLGYQNSYLIAIEPLLLKLNSNNLPPILSLKSLSIQIKIPYRILYDIVKRNGNDRYNNFSINKRNSNKKRKICAPDSTLLKIQKWINRYILSNMADKFVHNCSTAYMKHNSCIHNAKEHLGATWLIKMDIINFFGSIDERMVFNIFKKAGFPRFLSFELARLTTKEGGKPLELTKNSKARDMPYKLIFQDRRHQNAALGFLPQGAPTSPLLANMICYEMDKKINELANKNNLVYTRYSDDITFSTDSRNFSRDEAKKIIHEVTKILSEFNFERNPNKTKIIPPGARKIVTGLVVNDIQPRLPKKFKQNIELHLYYARINLHKHCINRKFNSLTGFYNHLLGLLLYAKSVDYQLWEKYKTEFERIQWPDIVKRLNHFSE